jgi:hypothetical protein
MEFQGVEVRIVAFYNDNIPEDVVNAQKAVFDRFGVPIEQVLTPLSHPDAIDNYISNNQFDVLTIFDIDCIPLRKSTITDAISIVTKTNCIYGAIQNANYIEGSSDYASPAFLCFSRQTYKLIDRPSFKETSRADVGAELTYMAIEKGLGVKLLKVSHVNVPLWKLSDGTMFGHGTNYENKVFHAFEIRKTHGSKKLFIEKCLEVISEKEYRPSV